MVTVANAYRLELHAKRKLLGHAPFATFRIMKLVYFKLIFNHKRLMHKDLVLAPNEGENGDQNMNIVVEL